MVLMTSLEKAIWNWMDTYPHEFADVQVRYSSLVNILVRNKILIILYLYDS